MISRRVFLAAAGALMALPARRLYAAAAPAEAAATVDSFYNTLLSTMKAGPQLGFAGRRERIGPAMQKAFDLPLMTRLTVGPQWREIAPPEQRQLVDAFSNYSIANYANRFDDYSGERFIVDPNPTTGSTGELIVHSKLIKSDGSPIELNYLMRQGTEGWRIIDVYLGGTASELAVRRSEFTAVLRRGGPKALVDLLQRKTAELSG